MKKDYNISTKKLPKGEVEITGTLEWSVFEAFEKEALEFFGQSISVPGFRKGAVPEAVTKKQVAEQHLLEEMAERALNKYYPLMVEEEKLDVVGRPQIAITKLARGNDFEFKIVSATVPEVKLPDYKKIAKEIELKPAQPVTEEDVAKTIEELRHMKLHQHDAPGTQHAPHSHTEEELPVVDDAFAQSFGKFATVQELKEKIKENLLIEKNNQAADKRRTDMLEKITSETTVEIPDLFIKAEVQKMIAQIEFEVGRAGMKFEEYLSKIGKTKADMEKEFEPDAVKRAKFQLVLDKIAKEEKLIPTPEQVAEQTEKLMAMYPGADKTRTEAYAHLVLTNDGVMKFLETL